MIENVKIACAELCQHSDSLTSLELQVPMEFVKNWMVLCEQRFKANLVNNFQKNDPDSSGPTPSDTSALSEESAHQERNVVLNPFSCDAQVSNSKENERSGTRCEDCRIAKSDSGENLTVVSPSSATSSRARKTLLPHTSDLIAANIETGFCVAQTPHGHEGQNCINLFLRITSIGLKVRNGRVCVVVRDFEKISTDDHLTPVLLSPGSNVTTKNHICNIHPESSKITSEHVDKQEERQAEFSDEAKENSSGIENQKLSETEVPHEDQNSNPSSAATLFVDNLVSGVQKRKRGRPRKIIVEQDLNDPHDRFDTDIFVEKDTSITKAETVQEQTTARQNRYSLRGKKLPAYIFGSGDSDDEEGVASLSLDSVASSREKTTAKTGRPLAGGLFLDAMKEEDHDYTITALKKTKKRVHANTAAVSSQPEVAGRKRMRVDMSGLPKFARRARNNQKLASCRYCQRGFCDYSGVAMHVKRFHHEERDLGDYLNELKKLEVLQCSVCGMQCENRFRLQQHEDEKHRKLGPLQCLQCSKPFGNLPRLRAHIRAVHQVQGKAHACPHCQARFKWAATLKSHLQEIHAGVKAVSCPVCQKGFYRQSQLNRHAKIHGPDEAKLTCKLCPRKFWYINNLKRHVQIVHEPQGQRFHCSYCGRGFTRKESLIGHVEKVHFAIFSFRCLQCRAGFARSFALEKHMAVAHNMPDFKAPQGRPPRFKYHRSEEDVLCCSFCDQQFFYKAQLVQHVQSTHSEAFPFRCDVCQQGFLEEPFLLVHRSKAHGLPPNQDGPQTRESEGCSPTGPLQASDLSKGDHFVYLQAAGRKEAADQLDHKVLEPFAEGLNLGASLAALEGGSYLVEVEDGVNTVKYVIEHPEGASSADVEDIASLLIMAARESFATGDTLQEIVLEPCKSPNQSAPDSHNIPSGVVIRGQLPNEDVPALDEDGAVECGSCMETRLPDGLTSLAEDGHQPGVAMLAVEEANVFDDMGVVQAGPGCS